MIDVAFLGTDVRPAGHGGRHRRAAGDVDDHARAGVRLRARARRRQRRRGDRAAHRRPHAGRRGALRAGARASTWATRPRRRSHRARPSSCWPRRTARPRSSPSAQVADEVLVASLLNLDAVCEQLAGREDVLLVCAGHRRAREHRGRLPRRPHQRGARGSSAPTPRASPRRSRRPIRRRSTRCRPAAARSACAARAWNRTSPSARRSRSSTSWAGSPRRSDGAARR